MVTTASASFTASSADAARVQPFACALASAASERSNARTSCPALARFAAMPLPILPRPMNATFMLMPTVVAVKKMSGDARDQDDRSDNRQHQKGYEPPEQAHRIALVVE